MTDYLRLDKTKDRSYRFDCAIAPEVSQSDAFEKTLQSLIPDVLSGKNACCFAYGATGSGKTFTMTGNQQMPGLIPQGVDALFQQSDIQVSMQYVEIYNEQIKDLLQPSGQRSPDVREAPGKGIVCRRRGQRGGLLSRRCRGALGSWQCVSHDRVDTAQHGLEPIACGAAAADTTG